MLTSIIILEFFKQNALIPSNILKPPVSTGGLGSPHPSHLSSFQRAHQQENVNLWKDVRCDEWDASRPAALSAGYKISDVVGW